MRRLFYVPIIHTDPDLGQLGEGFEEQAKAVVGGDNLRKHKEVVRLYWQQIATYWEGKNVAGYKIFQDGMPADGEIAQQTVRSLAETGSVNHQILEQLMAKGALLLKTEDPELLKEEYFLTKDLLEKKSLPGSAMALFRYKQRKDSLLRARDSYMVKNIKEQLGEAETAICFIGAYHQVWARLPKTITVVTLKDPEKVKAYYQKFTSNRWEKEVDALGAYLTAPIDREIEGNDE